MPPAVRDPRLGKVLVQLRKRLGPPEQPPSQQAIATRAGLTTGAYAKIEKGKANPTWSTVIAIAEALNVSLGELAEAVEAEDAGKSR